MKLVLLWAAAACAAAAGRSCADYCACLTFGAPNSAYQTGCDCKGSQNQVEATAIYYEPVDYISLPTFIIDQPFFILNPYVSMREYSTNNIKSPNIQPKSTKPPPNTDIGAKKENSRNSNKRKEKDIERDIARRGPIYLDINVKPEGSQSLGNNNVMVTEDIVKLTEPNLVTCTELYTVLNSRKINDQKYINIRGPNQIHKYEHLSDTNLIKEINHKCSDIMYIVEKSQKEISENRPVKSGLFKMNGEKRSNEVIAVTEHLGLSKYENKHPQADLPTQSHFSTEVTNGIDEYVNNQEYTTVDYTKSPSITVTPTSNQHANSYSPGVTIVNNIQDVPLITTTDTTIRETYAAVTSIDTQNTLSTENSELLTSITSITNVNCSTPSYEAEASVKYEDQSALETRISKEFNVTKIEKPSEKISILKEAEIAPLKIITHEYSNDTVQSFIDGTEKVSDGGFKGGSILVDASESPVTIGSLSAETETTTAGTESSYISGKLFFLYNSHHIPAKFVQNPNGALHVGIDGITLCDKLTQNGERKSTLLTTLCKCYESNDCQ